MKIKTWVQIIVLLSITIAFGVVLISFYQKTEISKTIKKTTLTNEMVKVVNQREHFANDYMTYHQNEAVIQWQVMHDVIARLLQSSEFDTPEEQAILEDMREANVNINHTFTELIILQQDKQSGKKDIALLQKSEEQLRSQLLIYGTSIISGAYRLAEINQQNREDIIKKASAYTLLSLGILISLILFILLLFRIKIVDPLTELNERMRIVARGNLDYKISINKNDEIGEIFHSFNEMIIKVKERTTEQELIRAKLEKSNKELQQFAYIASHHLQEPLRMICSFLQLLEERYKGKLENDADEYIDFAVNGAKRLQSMIDDLLVFYKIETYGKPFALVNLENILNNILKNFQTTIEENDAVITHDTLPVINADEEQMTLLFENLLSNAIKFRAHKTPIIHISAKHNDKEWLFSISDNGIGIDPKYKKDIFDVFKRLVGAEYSGTGMGLAVCMRIVERHQGKIWVKSELGKGSTFYFTIPEQHVTISL